MPDAMPTIDLIVSAGHGEYGDLESPLVEVLWNPTGDDEIYHALFEAQQAKRDEDKLAAEMYSERTGNQPPPNVDLTWETVIRLHGDWPEIEAWYNALEADLSVAPSGDDSTFNYWPSGVGLASAVAPALGGYRPHELEQLIDRVCEELGLDRDEIGLP